ncbi:ligase-associated DNA damage response exonuclease [Oceanipulchritudo coccoides]|uniref:ligase-associated DNA damage response exonuclease n=1 Tax=Oceanipulchritudo coccoides TaxID=2706888 RepID=UPI001EE86CF3|nr:ligase-associated DNA damage response exonuclease [Oceanipulchritudo coccoides]
MQLSSAGLYCPAGEFHIDPWKKVPLAVVTHAHSDHARSGMGRYIGSASGEALLRKRVGQGIDLTALPFGKSLKVGDVSLSLHPAGHVLGSAQVRIEHKGEVVVVTGDHNATHSHSAAEAFEPVRCDLLITESTFGLPVYQWPSQESVIEEIHGWWKRNQEVGRTSILPCYPLGKTQRILAALDANIGPIALVGPGRAFLPHYKEAGVELPTCLDLTEKTVPELKGQGLVLVSFAGQEPALLKRLQPLSHGAASGWLQVRGVRRSRDFDRGFVLSDHSDWQGLLRCVRESGATRVGVTHGQTEVFARYLREVVGVDSFPVPTHFESSGD